MTFNGDRMVTADKSPAALPVVNLDDTIENADWTKQTWDMPPYMSPEFLLVEPDVEAFRKSDRYKQAVADGLIHDDEWVGDYAEPVTATNDQEYMLDPGKSGGGPGGKWAGHHAAKINEANRLLRQKDPEGWLRSLPLDAIDPRGDPAVSVSRLYANEITEKPEGYAREPHKAMKINASLIHPTQEGVGIEGVTKHMSKGIDDDNLPRVVEIEGGKYAIDDGHHRIAAQILGGESKIKVKRIGRVQPKGESK